MHSAENSKCGNDIRYIFKNHNACIYIYMCMIYPCEILLLTSLARFFFKVKAEVTNGSNDASLIRVHLTRVNQMAWMLSKNGFGLKECQKLRM